MYAFNPDTVTAEIERIEASKGHLEVVSAMISDLVQGMSGRKFRTLMSRLVTAMPSDLVYVEMGIYQAMTPLVVAHSNPDKTVIGIDDFSQFDKGGENLRLIRAAQKRLGVSNLQIRQMDFEEAFRQLRSEMAGKVGVLFFDASHDYRSLFLALQYAAKLVARGGIVVVDDCNYPHVRQATADMQAVSPEFKLIFEAYTGKHPGQQNVEEKAASVAGWWNGVHIIVHDPDGRYGDALQPPLPADLRRKFMQQHGFAGCGAIGAPTRLSLPGRELVNW